jgi:hypothetical protein
MKSSSIQVSVQALPKTRGDHCFLPLSGKTKPGIQVDLSIPHLIVFD